jgi:hypothetical protein
MTNLHEFIVLKEFNSNRALLFDTSEKFSVGDMIAIPVINKLSYDQLKTESEKDRIDMRHFQTEFIKADLNLRGAVKALKYAKNTLESIDHYRSEVGSGLFQIKNALEKIEETAVIAGVK